MREWQMKAAALWLLQTVCSVIWYLKMYEVSIYSEILRKDSRSYDKKSYEAMADNRTEW